MSASSPTWNARLTRLLDDTGLALLMALITTGMGIFGSSQLAIGATCVSVPCLLALAARQRLSRRRE